MTLVFTLTLLLSSALLFVVQPMFARLVLPLLGGTPAVWNTCMVFFQAVLLGGYLYAHLATRRLGIGRQAALHMAVVLGAFLLLPLAIPAGWTPPTDRNPVPWLLALLAVTLGLPFFAVSATAPLLQRWFSRTDHPLAGDPYFLYAASNVGSVGALVAYPLLVEPSLRLGDQAATWRWGYAGLAVLLAVCALLAIRRGVPSAREALPALDSGRPGPAFDTARPGPRRRLHWVALAAVPSSLMLGVTAHLSTDVAVVPLLWVVPLTLYLLTFVLVFARHPLLPHGWMVRLLPFAVVTLLLVMVIGATEPMGLVLGIHLAGFFVLAMVCHGELARDRPPAAWLTEFYVWMSVGGVVGGAFNALLAPQLFSAVAEYPLAVVAACLLWPGWMNRRGGSGPPALQVGDVLWPLALGLLTGGLILGFEALRGPAGPGGSGAGRTAGVVLTLGVPTLLAYLMSTRAVRFALAVGAVFLVSALGRQSADVYERERSFFGVYRVTGTAGEAEPASPLADEAGGDLPLSPRGLVPVRVNTIHHGTTVHGRQLVSGTDGAPARPDLPLTYYHPAGPAGRLIRALRPAGETLRLGVVGLGAGALAAYAGPGDTVTFFEIDPLVQRLAEDTRYFTYLSAARGRGAVVDVVLGDARLTLGAVPNGAFDLLVLDAFSSDAVPVHLLTLEAVRMYAEKLAPGGVMAFHTSNRYLRLDPVLAALARTLGLRAWVAADEVITAEDFWWDGRSPSRWIILAGPGEARPELPFAALEGVREIDPWTDDFADIWAVLDWGG